MPLSEGKKPKIRFGGMRGQIKIADDFDVLPDDLLAAFEGREPL